MCFLRFTSGFLATLLICLSPVHSQDVCYCDWRHSHEFPGSHVEGMTDYTTKQNSFDCADHCENTPGCKAFDYNVDNNRCYITSKDIFGLKKNTAVIHSFVERCQNNTFGECGPCSKKLNVMHRHHTKIDTRITSNMHEVAERGVLTEHDCHDLCAVDYRCTTTAYQRTTNKCFHGYCSRGKPATTADTTYVSDYLPHQFCPDARPVVVTSGLDADVSLRKQECCSHYPFVSFQVEGLTLIDGVTDEKECVRKCVFESNNCVSTDWNKRTNKCYHGYQVNMNIKSHSDVNHMFINRCTGGCDCQPKAIKMENHRVHDLHKYGGNGQFSEYQCVILCKVDDDCTQVDYDLNTQTCYHGFCDQPGLKPAEPATGINHYYIYDPCQY